MCVWTSNNFDKGERDCVVGSVGAIAVAVAVAVAVVVTVTVAVAVASALRLHWCNCVTMRWRLR